MRTRAIQSLIVLTDPACVYTLDLVHVGLTSADEIAGLVAERLGITAEHAAEVLDGLVGVGYVDRTGLDTVESKGLDDYDAWSTEALEHVAWLRAVGDEEHAQDIVGAIYAAWDTRSADPLRRRRGEMFRASESGRRHRARLRARSLGFAFADPDVDADALSSQPSSQSASSHSVSASDPAARAAGARVGDAAVPGASLIAEAG